MNFYEELGVAKDAPVEAIRQAYRTLARLLHPDNHSDPLLKSAAERQMVRLNEVLATLVDVQKRRNYDDSLIHTLPMPEAGPFQVAGFTMVKHIPWVVAFFVLVAAGVWYWRVNESSDVAAYRAPALTSERPAQPAQASQPVNAPPPKGLRSLVRLSRGSNNSNTPPVASPVTKVIDEAAESAAAPPPLQVPESREPEAAPVPPPVSGVASKVASLPTPPARIESEASLKPPKPPPPPAVSGFAGRWLYVPQGRGLRMDGNYPPEFIEFSLSEERGVMSGTYWARYRVPDKPVSPEVKFRVSGNSGQGGTQVMDWVSDDGAKGQMKILLRDATSLEVSWWTTAFGRHTALTSGTAVLVRQLLR